MKLILMADDAVGLSITNYLLDLYPTDIQMIVTTGANEIYRRAEEAGVPVCVFESEEALLAKISEGFDLGVMAWWPKILRSPLLEASRFGFINTHPSFLPYNRGKHSNFWVLVEQAPFGVTIHRVEQEIDAGFIVAQRRIAYDWADTGRTLYHKGQKEVVSLFCEVYPTLRTGNFLSAPQDLNVGSFHYAAEIDKASNIELDRMYQARDLLNMLRARTFEGHPGCWFEDATGRYEIAITIKKLS
jgi:methionyl-tRNA formyltransferase